MANLTLKDYMLVARYYYRYGQPLLSDAEYDAYMQQLNESGIYLDPIYENDPVPYEALRALGGEGILSETLAPANTEDAVDKYKDLVAENECLSIKSVNTYYDAYQWAKDFKGKEMILTPKLDGINTRRAYEYIDGQLIYRLALTRGRIGSALDVTSNMRYCSPISVPAGAINTNVVINSESFLPANDIPALREKYGIDIKIPRGAGMSLMRVSTYKPEDIAKLRSIVFKFGYADTLSGGLDLAKSMGFDVVPYWLTELDVSSLEAFTAQVEGLIKTVHQYATERGWPTDGIVCEINNRHEFKGNDEERGYSSSNLAFKVGLWEPGVYTSTVTAIELAQQAEQANCVAIVKPVIAQGGQTLSRVNLFNPDTMIRRGINIGSEISFKYKNETTIDLI